VCLHAHAAGLAIRGSGEVGVVGARAILSVQEDVVSADTTVAVVVSLEVTGLLVEAELVQQVVVLVGGVEELGNRGVGVGLVVGGVQVQWVVELEVAGLRASVGQERLVGGVVLPVGLRNTVVTTGCLEPISAVRVPAERAGVGIEWVRLVGARSLSGVVDTPGVDLVAVVGGIVDNGVDILSGSGIDVGQKPVAGNVGLDPPGQLKLAVGIDEVHKLGLRLVQTSAGVLDSVSLLALLRLSLSRACLDRKSKGVDGSLKTVDGVGGSPLAERRNLALEERVAEREDFAVLANLPNVSFAFVPRYFGRHTLTLKSALSMSRPLAVCLKYKWVTPFLLV
jgi:hypothetical protein